MKPSSPLRILFVTPECTPFAQVGGLGDVAAALPRALRERGHDVRVVMPLYGQIDRSPFERLSQKLRVPLGREMREAGVWRGEVAPGVPLYLIEQSDFFDRDGVYGPNGSAFDDNLRRFAFASRAAGVLSDALGFAPDVVHANDWPTALSVLHAKHAMVPSVLTLHNVGYQGQFPLGGFEVTGLPGGELSPGSLEHFGSMNLLKGAILNASMLTTVSPTYAKEIQGQALGCGLDGVLRSRGSDLRGILNGIDVESWNPSTDPALPSRFDAADLSGKAVCKASLQREAGLPVRPEVPLFGLVTRLTFQKGLDVLARALGRILRLDAQFVLLGTGDEEAEKFFRLASRVRPERFHAWIGFDPALSRRIEGGCDFFVMPSRYEPCGLNQMYSLRYGTLPIVRATGGLEDSVENYDEATGGGTGFKVYDLTPQSMYDVIGWAVSTYYDRPMHVEGMRRRAMVKDFSWEKAAGSYEEVYGQALRLGSFRKAG
jgi:starch synthase